MGTPVLLYYQRVFFYAAGLIYALFGGLKGSVVATIAIFLVIGAYGMRRALSVVTKSRLLHTVGSLGFLCTNYVFTDWLDPHGDLGEFAALMIVPWLLYWCLNLVTYQHASFLLIPVIVLLVNAHSTRLHFFRCSHSLSPWVSSPSSRAFVESVTSPRD